MEREDAFFPDPESDFARKAPADVEEDDWPGELEDSDEGVVILNELATNKDKDGTVLDYFLRRAIRFIADAKASTTSMTLSDAEKLLRLHVYWAISLPTFMDTLNVFQCEWAAVLKDHCSGPVLMPSNNHKMALNVLVTILYPAELQELMQTAVVSKVVKTLPEFFRHLREHEKFCDGLKKKGSESARKAKRTLKEYVAELKLGRDAVGVEAMTEASVSKSGTPDKRREGGKAGRKPGVDFVLQAASSGECFTCGEMGHKSFECPTASLRGVEKGGVATPVSSMKGSVSASLSKSAVAASGGSTSSGRKSLSSRQKAMLASLLDSDSSGQSGTSSDSSESKHDE